MFRKMFSALTLFAVMTIPCLTFVGCESDGPAEEAGEKIDEAGENIGDAAEDAVD